MRIFQKFFVSIFFFVFAVILVLSFILAQYQISYAKQQVIDQNKIAADLLSREIELGYFKSEWPYESLDQLAHGNDFIFWWVVGEKGTIYRSNNVSFMGTNALDYFPGIAGSVGDGLVYVDQKGNYAIYFKDLRIGAENFRFWLGFSLVEIQSIESSIFLAVSAVSIVSISVLAVFIYFIVRSYTKPIINILKGTSEISKGNLDYNLKQTSNDELGELAKHFNAMTEALRGQRKELESYSKNLEKEVSERTKELTRKNEELEKFNKLAVGRELKMIELKKKIEDLEGRAKKQ